MAAPIQVPITSPIKGVVRASPREGQPEGTCWDALNVLPYDRYGRKRVAQRGGILSQYPNSSNLGGFVQGMTEAPRIVYPGQYAPVPLYALNQLLPFTSFVGANFGPYTGPTSFVNVSFAPWSFGVTVALNAITTTGVNVGNDQYLPNAVFQFTPDGISGDYVRFNLRWSFANFSNTPPYYNAPITFGASISSGNTISGLSFSDARVVLDNTASAGLYPNYTLGQLVHLVFTVFPQQSTASITMLSPVKQVSGPFPLQRALSSPNQYIVISQANPNVTCNLVTASANVAAVNLAYSYNISINEG